MPTAEDTSLPKKLLRGRVLHRAGYGHDEHGHGIHEHGSWQRELTVTGSGNDEIYTPEQGYSDVGISIRSICTYCGFLLRLLWLHGVLTARIVIRS
jgi:hypothetical protein